MKQNDWRLIGQNIFLMKKELMFVPKYSPYSDKWEHEHCCFCSTKISQYEGDLHEGYCTIDEKHTNWICEDCFRDFKDMFKWIVVN